MADVVDTGILIAGVAPPDDTTGAVPVTALTPPPELFNLLNLTTPFPIVNFIVLSYVMIKPNATTPELVAVDCCMLIANSSPSTTLC